MKVLLGLRVVLILFVAALLPLELGRCALMPMQASAAGLASDHHDDGSHESAPERHPGFPPDPCCWGYTQLPAVTVSASISIKAPLTVSMPPTNVPMLATAFRAQDAFVRLEPEERSGSPPRPSTASQSPRGPPYSA